MSTPFSEALQSGIPGVDLARIGCWFHLHSALENRWIHWTVEDWDGQVQEAAIEMGRDIELAERSAA